MERERGWIRRPIAGGETAQPESHGSETLRTFIDQGAAFEGTLRLTETLRIDSDFRGAIESEATVIVGEGAGIEADIRAREIIICGAVVGNVQATRLLTIRAGGRLHGDVEAPCLEIERHALFNGRTTMVRPEVALRAGQGAETEPPRAGGAAGAGSGRPLDPIAP